MGPQCLPPSASKADVRNPPYFSAGLTPHPGQMQRIQACTPGAGEDVLPYPTSPAQSSSTTLGFYSQVTNEQTM